MYDALRRGMEHFDLPYEQRFKIPVLQSEFFTILLHWFCPFVRKEVPSMELSVQLPRKLLRSATFSVLGKPLFSVWLRFSDYPDTSLVAQPLPTTQVDLAVWRYYDVLRELLGWMAEFFVLLLDMKETDALYERSRALGILHRRNG